MVIKKKDFEFYCYFGIFVCCFSCRPFFFFVGSRYPSFSELINDQGKAQSTAELCMARSVNGRDGVP